jgi:hypothetical protein
VRARLTTGRRPSTTGKTMVEPSGLRSCRCSCRPCKHAKPSATSRPAWGHRPGFPACRPGRCRRWGMAVKSSRVDRVPMGQKRGFEDCVDLRCGGIISGQGRLQSGFESTTGADRPESRRCRPMASAASVPTECKHQCGTKCQSRSAETALPRLAGVAPAGGFLLCPRTLATSAQKTDPAQHQIVRRPKPPTR